MNESLKQALKIALGVVLVINQAVFFYLAYNYTLSESLRTHILISGGVFLSTLIYSFIWVHAKCKEEKKHDYVLFFKLLSVAVPGLCFAIFDILPQKWIEYINVGLMILIFPFLIWLVFFT